MKELRGVAEGPEAGQVFHEFASFCDQQLQNPDSREDFRRIQTLREKKAAEVREYEKMIKSKNSQSKDLDNLKMLRSKAKKWFELDDREYQRLDEGRKTLMSQSLENYLRCLRACDAYDNDALRFSALWLEHCEEDAANEAVVKEVDHVPSRKFASLMNQWTSRILDIRSNFQSLLAKLVFRICVDHPFHGMYFVFTNCRSKGVKDPIGLSRHAATMELVGHIKNHKRAVSTWITIHNSNVNFVKFAQEKLDGPKFREGAKVPLRSLASGVKLERDGSAYRIPPPAMRIPLRSDCDYSHIPLIHKFHHDFSVAGGLSAPKIVTTIATDGQKSKQLVSAWKPFGTLTN